MVNWFPLAEIVKPGAKPAGGVKFKLLPGFPTQPAPAHDALLNDPERLASEEVFVMVPPYTTVTLDPAGIVPFPVACNTTAPIVSVTPSYRACCGKLLAWNATPEAKAGAATRATAQNTKKPDTTAFLLMWIISVSLVS
jgi:hypothetical protein